MAQGSSFLPSSGRFWNLLLIVECSVAPFFSTIPNPLVLFNLPADLSIPTQTFEQTVNPSPLRIEIRLSQRRATLYRGQTPLKTYPVAVGKQGWETPQGTFAVKQMLRDPTWIHPLTNAVIPAGNPENPLGRYWIGFWTNGKNWIGFHGTPNPKSVGRAASHGCLRMLNRDVEELFQQVQVGTPVVVKP